MQSLERVLILASGRDFPTFNVCFRSDPNFEVVAFTVAQIPGDLMRRTPHNPRLVFSPGRGLADVAWRALVRAR